MSKLLQRLFTVESANRTLPQIRPVLEEIVRTRQQMGGVIREVHRLHREVHAEGRPTPDLRLRLERGLSRLGEFDNRIKDLVAEVNRFGVSVKDPEVGLIDFPTVVEGRAAFLCYMLGEDEVAHWHLVEEGFNGRRPLRAQKRK